MTVEEQRLADDKMRAELAKLQVEIAMLRDKQPHVDERERAELRKLVAEAGQLKVSMFLAPFLAAAALMGATAALVRLLFV